MSFKNSFVKWVYDKYLKAPDPPPEPIYLYEKVDESRYRSISDPDKVVSQIDAVKEISRLERQPFSTTWAQKDRFFCEEPLPEPEPSQPQRSLKPPEQQEQELLPPEKERPPFESEFLQRIANGEKRLLSKEEKTAINEFFISLAGHAETKEELEQNAQEHKNFYRQGYSDAYIAKVILPQARHEVQIGMDEGRLPVFREIDPKTKEDKEYTLLSYLKYTTEEYQQFKPEHQRFPVAQEPVRYQAVGQIEGQQQQQDYTRDYDR